MISGRLANVLLAVGVGVGTGVYVFQPLLQEYQSETQGTWMRPGDEQRIKSWRDKTESEPAAKSPLPQQSHEEKK
ncbi:hypothetical protein BDB00DRAFT_868108 [Zychaea mexicana]|uniref:uncharacterized protein n=1 Tax=Zychaea mexicana TaxID=64656 RepID=UPI0022FF0138|nr:uncharacterized protein BDB00DRAFT_868108 [Zychaea mexicana]KAI9497975.1 hypothetical protein BDB00DRAFT_868108 [Zychaea mexicana]